MDVTDNMVRISGRRKSRRNRRRRKMARYYVEKVIDVDWRNDEEGKEYAVYRVRWIGYPPKADTWEQVDSFESQLPFQDFQNRYNSLKEKRAAEIKNLGQEPTEETTRHINVLSPAIERITCKRIKKEAGIEIPLYKVLWKGRDKKDFTWETEALLIHAKEKLEEYFHLRRIRRTMAKASKAKEKEKEKREDPDQVRRTQERKFFEDLQNGTLNFTGDLYSRVKSRRTRSKSDCFPSASLDYEEEDDFIPETPKKTHKKRKLRRNTSCSKIIRCKEENILKEASESMDVDQNTIKITSGLPQYDPEEVEEEFRRQERFTVALREEEFCAAVNDNDYALIFASLRSDSVPDVNFNELFLDAARCGKRDMAVLLATRVEDLTTCDSWGENALTIAARLGDVCFAYQLSAFGIPLDLRNQQNQTPLQVAANYKQKHFLKFFRKFKKERSKIELASILM